LFYTSRDRREIRRNFVSLIKGLPGSLKSGNPFTYPEAEVDFHGRRITVFFHVHEINRTSFLNLVYRTPVQAKETFLLLKKDFFRPIRGEENLAREVGEIVPDLENGYVVRTKDAEGMRTLLRNEKIREGLSRLKDFPNILVDSGMLLVSKPYDGIQETEPGTILENLERVEHFAAMMEGAPRPEGEAAATGGGTPWR
ncbi:MAG: hypothetical protein HY760_03670, partial [Nitrospirae bacterium]|nr:hypothetical protein [Nitrospirota bacterium]